MRKPILGKCKRAISFITGYANRTKQVKEKLEGVDTSIQFDIEGESPFNIRISGGKLLFSSGRLAEPDATIKSKSEIFYKIITQEIDPEEAFTTGKYTVEGALMSALEFQYIGNLTQQSHRQVFKLLSAFAKLI